MQFALHEPVATEMMSDQQELDRLSSQSLLRLDVHLQPTPRNLTLKRSTHYHYNATPQPFLN